MYYILFTSEGFLWLRNEHQDVEAEKSIGEGVYWRRYILMTYFAGWGDAFDHTEEHDDPGRQQTDHHPPVQAPPLIHRRRDVEGLSVPEIRSRAAHL